MAGDARHSPEPWRLLGDDASPCGGDLVDAGGHTVAFSYEMAEWDRRRSAACVNALAGVPTEELERLGTGGILRALNGLAVIDAAGLLAALGKDAP